MSHTSEQYSEGEAISPPKKHKSRRKAKERDTVSLSPSDYEDNNDSLDIKPPQHRSRHRHNRHRPEPSDKSRHRRDRGEREGKRDERRHRAHVEQSRGEERDLRERLERDRQARRERELERDQRRKERDNRSHRTKRERADRVKKEEDELEDLYKKQIAEREQRAEREHRKASSAKHIEVPSSPEHSDHENEPARTEQKPTAKDEEGLKSSSDSSSSSDEGEASTTSSSETEEYERDEEEEEDAGKKPRNGKYNSADSAVESDEDQPRRKRAKEEPNGEDVEMNESPNHTAIEASPPPSPLELKEVLPPYLPAIMGCRSVDESFDCLNKIEEGTYGVVYRAKDKRTDEIVALKRLKMEREKEGFPITSLREVSTLLKAQHPNIVTVREIVVGSNMDKIYMVMDYVEHDMKSLMETMKAKKQVFLPGEVKCLLQQLLRAVAHLHDNWILHRDLKTSNLLLSHKGILKVGDFGLAREYGSPLGNYTSLVVTLWYRAPELLLGAKEYSTPIDIWSVGCIFGEFLTMNAIFQGKSEKEQIDKIFRELGTPSEAIWKGYKDLPIVGKVAFVENPISNLRKRFATRLSELGLDLLQKFLTYDPAKRITAEEALKHPYLKEHPLPIDPAMFPTWPAKSEQNGPRKAHSPKPPSGGRAFKQLGAEDAGFYISESNIDRRVPVGGGFCLKG